MKIAQIAYSGFGGLGSVVFSLVAADRAREYKWSIGFIGEQQLEASYPSRCDALGVRYEQFRSVPGRPFGAWLALATWLEDVRPDVVICHSITAVPPCRWYAWRHGVRLVVVEHTPNQVKTRTEWAASRVGMVLADHVVLLTDEYRQELQKAHGPLFQSKKVSVIPNGIDTDAFVPALTARAGGTPVLRLGMAARFSFSKRQDLLVATVGRLKQLRSDLNCELSLAGDGSELERVRDLAATSPASSQIQFTGLLSERDVAPWLRTLDIYVHATEGETLSTSLLQAMATGLPIVASDIPGVRNLLGARGDYGRCVANDADAFAEAIIELVDRPDEALASGRRARARVLAEYSNAVMLQRYLEVIERIGRP